MRYCKDTATAVELQQLLFKPLKSVVNRTSLHC